MLTLLVFKRLPPTHIAILDGGGERYSHQFELAEQCQCLCVVVDHNSSDSDAEVDLLRLESIVSSQDR